VAPERFLDWIFLKFGLAQIAMTELNPFDLSMDL